MHTFPHVPHWQSPAASMVSPALSLSPATRRPSSAPRTTAPTARGVSTRRRSGRRAARRSAQARARRSTRTSRATSTPSRSRSCPRRRSHRLSVHHVNIDLPDHDPVALRELELITGVNSIGDAHRFLARNANVEPECIGGGHTVHDSAVLRVGIDNAGLDRECDPVSERFFDGVCVHNAYDDGQSVAGYDPDAHA